jgi:HK97 family phage portal protein
MKFNWFKKKKDENIPKPYTLVGQTNLIPYSTNYEKWLDEAYKNPFFNAALKEIISDFNSCRIGVFKKKDDRIEEQPNNRVNKIIKNPNSELTQSQFQEYFITWYLTGGGLLLYKTKGTIDKELFIYAPNTFNIRRADGSFKLIELEIGGKSVVGNELKYYRVVRGINAEDSIAGRTEKFKSQYEALATSIDMANFAISHQTRQLKNSGRRTGILSYQGHKSNAQKEEMKQTFANFTSGANTGTVALLPGEKYDFKEMDITPQEMDWLASLQYIQEIITTTMGVPIQLLSSKSGTYNNIKELKKKIYNDTIIPLLKLYCDQMTMFLKDELGEDTFIWYDTSEIPELQPDIMEVTEKLSKALDGKVTLNQFYKILQQKTGIEIDQLPAELGNKILTEQNKIFLDDLNFEPAVPQGEEVLVE